MLSSWPHEWQFSFTLQNANTSVTFLSTSVTVPSIMDTKFEVPSLIQNFLCFLALYYLLLLKEDKRNRCSTWERTLPSTYVPGLSQRAAERDFPQLLWMWPLPAAFIGSNKKKNQKDFLASYSPSNYCLYMYIIPSNFPLVLFGNNHAKNLIFIFIIL